MTDPTRIDLSLDPRTRRIEGVATHGMTPFSCPLISHIVGNLWTGGCVGGLSLPEEIKHVVSLYPWEAYVGHHEVRSVLSVRMYDSLDQALEQVEALAAWVSVCGDDAPTLVHCQAGLNRSGLVAATALMLRGRTPDDAIALLRAKRSPAVLCNPAFEQWVRDYGEEAEAA